MKKPNGQNLGTGTARPLRKLGVATARTHPLRRRRKSETDIGFEGFCKEFNRRAESWLRDRAAL
jgi:hypothetical protein